MNFNLRNLMKFIKIINNFGNNFCKIIKENFQEIKKVFVNNTSKYMEV